MSEIVVVAEFSSRPEAEVAKSLLESAGIKSNVSADDAGGLYAFPNAAGFGPVRLMVNSDDLSVAKEILANQPPA